VRAMFLEGDAGHKRRERVYIKMTENNKERYSRPLGNPSNNKAFNLTFMPYRLCIPQIESLRKSSIQLGFSRRAINRRQCRPRTARKFTRDSGMFVTKCIQSQQKRSLKKKPNRSETDPDGGGYCSHIRSITVPQKFAGSESALRFLLWTWEANPEFKPSTSLIISASLANQPWGRNTLSSIPQLCLFKNGDMLGDLKPELLE